MPLPTLGAGPSAPAACGEQDLYTYLVSWWDLDEESGTREDSHGSNDLTDNNTVLYDTGVLGNASAHVAANDEHLTSESTDFDLAASDFAFAIWVNAATISSNSNIICKRANPNVTGYQLHHVDDSPDTIRWKVANAGDEASADTGAVSTSTWYFLVATYNAGTGGIQIILNDGTPATDTLSGAMVANTVQPVAFGTAAWSLGFNDLNGLLDEAALWEGYIPSAGEITWLYNSGAGRSYSDLVAAYGP